MWVNISPAGDTVDDPKPYTKPFVLATVQYKWLLDRIPEHHRRSEQVALTEAARRDGTSNIYAGS